MAMPCISFHAASQPPPLHQTCPQDLTKCPKLWSQACMRVGAGGTPCDLLCVCQHYFILQDKGNVTGSRQLHSRPHSCTTIPRPITSSPSCGHKHGWVWVLVGPL